MSKQNSPRRARRTCIALVLGMGAWLSAARPARAEDPFAGGPDKPISAGLLLGFGFALGEDYNPWGLGVGVRAGYNYGRLYLGGRFVFHLGTTDTTLSAGNSEIDVDYNLWELGAEAGYDIPLIEHAILRPGLLLGISNLTVSSSAALFGASISGSDLKLVLSPGASALYDLTPDIFLGADLRLPVLIGGGSIVGLVLYLTGGIRF